MRLTLEDILKRIGGYTDQDASVPTGTDLTNRVNYVNRAVGEWADTEDWEELNQTYNFTIPAASTVSLALPSYFSKPMSALFLYDKNPPTSYKIIDKYERATYNVTDEVCYLDGNYADGHVLIVPKGLASGASVAMDIKAQPSALATLTDVSIVPDSEYLVQRAIAYVLESRGDSRFPLVKADSDRLLAVMIEQKNAGNKGKTLAVPTNSNFVIGED